MEKPAGAAEEAGLCPICKGQGQEVKTITVKHLIIENTSDSIEEGKYYICLNKECDVVYYNTETNTVFNRDEVKIPIWYKKDADPQYICYCNHVTEQQITDAVLKDGAVDLRDIIRLTGAMKNGKCEINNPLGKCCSPVIQETIDKALNIKRLSDKDCSD